MARLKHHRGACTLHSKLSAAPRQKEQDKKTALPRKGKDRKSVTGASALVDGIIDLVISHPRERLAIAAVQAIIDALKGRSSGGARNEQAAQHLLPFDIHIAESV
ncbi:hypothetical protein [Marinobacterium sedimentorum]|uniref:hypothetical protein n=1 Tax=Marinobacterium sedimentorum TaxID=2927804 RepID=UPI0020C6172B|nr:hypothetical protein [Marinobacterium sedimentorum]MCP8687258.1 hypothetical protein [Marinobacterium sedimentorum]